MKANQLHCCDWLLSTNSRPCCLHPAAVIHLQCFRAGLAEITLCTQGPQAKAPPPALSSVRSRKLSLLSAAAGKPALKHSNSLWQHLPTAQKQVADSNFSFPK